MKKTITSPIFLVVCLTVACMLYACKGRTEMPTEEADSTSMQDTVYNSDEDSVDEVVVEPTKKADELFDDFAFAFMKNRYFQKQRIAFPLPHKVDGEEGKIEKNDWQFDRMFSQYEMYTLIFDSMKGEKAAKDTTLRHVTVEELDLDTQRAKCYNFKRDNGEWRLTALTEQTMGESENREFYDFYHKFASDAEFKTKHICNPLEFSTFDDDAFETVEGIIAPEQFEDFAPELPTSKITNILYGQSYLNSNTRVLSLRTLAGGMESTMVFKKIDGEWKLTRLEN